MVLFLPVFLAFALGLAVSFGVRDICSVRTRRTMLRGQRRPGMSVRGRNGRSVATVKSLPVLAENKTCFSEGLFSMEESQGIEA